MANTEGMTDEGMASLLSPSPALGGDLDKKQKRPPSAFKKRRAAMERRMKQEPGDRPAATVLRASPRSTTVKPASSNIETETQKESIAKQTKPPILGSIVERPVHQRTQQSRRQSPRMISPLGSPSVDVPLGTFCKSHAKKKQQETVIRDSAKKDKNRGPLTAATASSGASTIAEASRGDADAMLAQMSSEEIRDSIEELHAALSPEIISFLKQRKSKAKKTGVIGEKQQQKEQTQSRSPPSRQQSPAEKEPQKTLPIVPEAAIVSIENANIYVNQNDDEFHQACVLLRSTSLQQVQWAARTVCYGLEEQQKLTSNGKENPDYPVLLPVSLRCVLDTPSSGGSICLLHSYVLRSLYALLCLSAPSDHVIDNHCQSSMLIHQEFFMDDAVSTPPLDKCYANTTNVGQPLKVGSDTVAYSTSSSTTSAQADGEAFRQDPMWTLLSRMRIVPRLAQLLSYKLPDEAIESTCGILTMLAVRSPGAAAAIAQHATLFPRLLKRAGLLPPTDDEESFNDTSAVALPALILLITSARQSRTVAASLPFDLIVPNILGQTPGSSQEWLVQRHAVILWRTMLRYGLGLSHVPTFITLAVPNLASALLNSESAKETREAIAADYLTAFSLVCEHVAFLRSQPALDDKNRSTGDRGDALVDTAWLTSLVRQCVEYLEASHGPTREFNGDQARLHTACMRLIFSSLELDIQSRRSCKQISATGKIVDVERCCVAINAVWESGTVQLAFKLVSPTFANQGTSNGLSLDHEAVVCALIEAFVSLLLVLAETCLDRPDDDAERLVVSHLVKQCRDLFLKVASAEAKCRYERNTMVSEELPAARQGWINKAHFLICRFLAVTSTESETQKSRLAMQSSVFTLLARLQHGQETMADYLLQQDVLFRTASTFSSKEDARSDLATMLRRELYATEQSRVQLDHSFKLLHRSLGAGEGVSYELDTLLSTADSQRVKQPMNSLELLLPLGDLWLWNILSGAVVPPSTVENSEVDGSWAEATNIVSTCLSILLELEQMGSLYTGQVSNGSKLYHLFNVCLYPENVIRDETVGEIVATLFDEYTSDSNGVSLESSFLETCSRHSQISQERKGSENEKEDKEIENFTLGDSSSVEIVSLENFAGDLCDAYVEYGAQYDAFTKCVRFLLRPGFPPKVRCETIHRLRQVLHLLTLPSEQEDAAGPAMISLLESSLAGGLPDRDGSVREAPQVLDMVAAVLKGGGDGISRWTVDQESYFALFAVAVLARSLASSAASSMEASKRRMKDFPRAVLEMVVNTASRLLASPRGDKHDLITSVLDVCVKRTVHKETIRLVHEDYWEEAARALIDQVNK